jgi:hypothetical protein
MQRHCAHSADGVSSRLQTLEGDGSLAGAKAIFARAFARRSGAYLALAALLVQFVLSFAHIHKHDIAFSRSDRSDVVSLTHARSMPQAATQQPSRLADDDDHCPICFSGFLLSNSSLPDAPVTLRSLQFAEVDCRFNPVSDQVFQPRHVAFLSRAPPIA